MLSLKSCYECGGQMEMVAKPGRLTRYKNMPGLEVPAEFEIPTCLECGEEWINDDIAEALDVALEVQYVERIQRLAVEALQSLSGRYRQSHIERTLGLGQGYLSKVKNGFRTPSAELALHLASIALNPDERLREVEALLSGGFGATMLAQAHSVGIRREKRPPMRAQPYVPLGPTVEMESTVPPSGTPPVDVDSMKLEQLAA